MNAFIIILIVIAAMFTILVVWARAQYPIGRAPIEITGTATFVRTESPSEDFTPQELEK